MDRLAEKGYAPNSVINNTQTTSWQEFATGDYAFGENGTWQLANAKKLTSTYGIIPIPAQRGRHAPAPTGGEFVSIPVQNDTGRYATSPKLVDLPDQRATTCSPPTPRCPTSPRWPPCRSSRSRPTPS